MLFTYKPEGAEPRVWQIKAGQLLSPEMEAIERVTGTFYPQWSESLLNGSASAARALLWVLLKRENPTLRFDDVVFAYDDFDLDYDLDEKAEIVEAYDAAIAAGAPSPSDGYTAMIEAYRAQLPVVEEAPQSIDLDAVDDPEAHRVDAPKARSAVPSSEPGTSGSSRGISAVPPLTSTA